jgi:hypothetical protein
MTDVPRQTGERRRYWLSLAVLAVVLPTAIVVNGWNSLAEWRTANSRTPLVVERGTTQRFAGARWQLTGLHRLSEGTSKAILVVAELEAGVDDPNRLRQGLCQVVLTDDKGRRWLPAFLPGRAVRQALPAAAAKPRCGAFSKAEAGATIAMAETFTVPDGATGLTLFVTIAGARPEYLVFK